MANERDESVTECQIRLVARGYLSNQFKILVDGKCEGDIERRMKADSQRIE